MDDVIQEQILASGYCPGLSEAGGALGAGGAATSGRYQNCSVARTAGNAVGFYDITIGGNGPAPTGPGGPVAAASPPLAVAAGNTAPQARCRFSVRSILRGAGVGVTNSSALSYLHGSQLTPAVPNLIRVFTGTAAAPADADFDFTISRVIDPTEV